MTKRNSILANRIDISHIDNVTDMRLIKAGHCQHISPMLHTCSAVEDVAGCIYNASSLVALDKDDLICISSLHPIFQRDGILLCCHVILI